MRKQRKKDRQREVLVVKNEPLYKAWKTTGMPLRDYIRTNRMQLDRYRIKSQEPEHTRA